MRLPEYIELYGQPFSETLRIDLKSQRNEEIVKWFLASILHSKRMSQVGDFPGEC